MNPRVVPLIERWKAEYLAGRVIAVEELCRDCPELIPEVSSIVELARTLDGSNRTPIDSVPQSHTRTIIHELKRFLEPPQKPDEIGRLGEYRILELLGEGGMGAVFKAEETGLNRIVALKVLKPEIAAHAISRQRFVREAKNASSIQHDHIIPIFRVGEHNGVPYLVMPLLQGETLSDLLEKQQRLPLLQVCRIGREIALGLEAAHERGMIHRDIKPSNIWLEGDAENFKRVRILDFGLARMVDGSDQFSSTSAVVGTPAYMAPEQASGRMKVDHRADLFSLGCVIYQAATGISPFERGGTLPTLTALAMDIPQSPSDLVPTLPFAFSELVMGMLEKQPHQRTNSASEIAERLEYISSHAQTLPTKSRSKPTRRETVPDTVVSARRRSIVPYLMVFFVVVGGAMAAMYGLMPRGEKTVGPTQQEVRPPGYDDALKLRKEGKSTEALTAFRKVLERDPNDRDTLIEIACLELELNRLANAEVVFAKLTELMPNNPVGYIGQYFINIEGNRYDVGTEGLARVANYETQRMMLLITTLKYAEHSTMNRPLFVASYLRRMHDMDLRWFIPEVSKCRAIDLKTGEIEQDVSEMVPMTKKGVRKQTVREAGGGEKTIDVQYDLTEYVPVTTRIRVRLPMDELFRWDGAKLERLDGKMSLKAGDSIYRFFDELTATEMAKRFLKPGAVIRIGNDLPVVMPTPKVMPAPEN